MAMFCGKCPVFNFSVDQNAAGMPKRSEFSETHKACLVSVIRRLCRRTE